MLFFHWSMIIIVPAMLFAMWAQRKVKSTYTKFSEVGTQSGMTGAEVAHAILRDANIALASDPQQYPAGTACALEAVPGHLTDHYDPRSRTLRLSEEVYHGRSIAALGIAAHEVGHAIQHARLYSPLMMRNIVYPVCSIGSTLAFPLFLIGLFVMRPLIMVAIALYVLAVFFTLITLPVEFNASSRALTALQGGGYMTQQEIQGTRKVLTAAAMTYVAAAAVAISQLIRMFIMSRD